MQNQQTTQQLIDFLNQSPTPYHAVAAAKKILMECEFTELTEGEEWRLKPGGKYFFSRRDASLLAFIYGRQNLTEDGLRIIGAHTDSPTLKVKPRPERTNHTYLQLGIEVYGGALLNPWFDRDLSIAGRVTVKDNNGLSHHLIDFERPVAIIPSLAIHLDREANKGRTVNPQEHMRPILLQAEEGDATLRGLLSREFSRSGLGIEEADILEYDLSFYDTQGASLVGVNQDFLASARLDNLLSCFAGLQAITAAGGEHSAVVALFDHEEVGSQSDIGANGNMLLAFIERLAPSVEQRYQLLANSMLMSVDNAHGIHPNYPQKHDENHGPKLNSGPVIKVDANQSYATSSATASLVRLLADQAQVPVQSYVTRADMRCGSTIGPMSSAKAGIPTIDLGVPTFAMHSIRELAGAKDLDYLGAILACYLKTRNLSL